MYHTPVMLNECIEGLKIKPDGVYVDVTFGGGGHSKAILEKLNSKGKLIAFDQDDDAIPNLPIDKKLLFIDQNFEFVKTHLQYQGYDKVDGLLADLGVSSHQFDEEGRGFSFRFDDSKLDMRMNQSASKSASEILNNYNEKELADVLFQYGELKNSRRLASAIKMYCKSKKIETVIDLKNSIIDQTPKIKDWKFLAQVFQALRIEVNGEINALKNLLSQCPEIIKPGGRLVVMSYHSLEDRLVKNFMNSGNFEGKLNKDFYGNIKRPFDALNKKTIVANEKELHKNTRARSAKLRIAERNDVS